MQLIDQKRSGLLPEHKGLKLGRNTYNNVRLTIPVREALLANGADISLLSQADSTFTVTPGETLPEGIVATRILGTSHLGLRLHNEPPYPGEIGEACWEQIDFTPCPKCNHALVWYEAGFVPGYRVCAGPKHHHFLAHGE